jgi:hypothetical protein
MKKFAALAAGAALIALALTPAAQASVTTSTLTAGFTGKAGTKAHPRAGNFSAAAQLRNDDGTVTPPVNDIIISLDRNLQLNGKSFASTTAKILDSSMNANDPRAVKAKIGTGTATARMGTAQLTFRTTLYNGPGGRSVVVFVESNEFSGIKKAIDAPVLPGANGFGKQIRVTLPPQLKQPVPGAFPSLTSLNITQLGRTTTVAKRVKVGKRFVTKRVKVGYIESVGSTAGKYRYGATFTFNSLAPQTALATSSAR